MNLEPTEAAGCMVIMAILFGGILIGMLLGAWLL